eukprot:TRINITY_DN12693_c0_g1_i3.p1 TRINITY_DN12693_c0_g1~~TRINITY_DN12693_c0_g1_i3.p1  ORF type:complete len:588 (+),score=169.62 TRINITY_DN12693_c0_g1_i3:98-1861(+)
MLESALSIRAASAPLLTSTGSHAVASSAAAAGGELLGRSSHRWTPLPAMRTPIVGRPAWSAAAAASVGVAAWAGRRRWAQRRTKSLRKPPRGIELRASYVQDVRKMKEQSENRKKRFSIERKALDLFERAGGGRDYVAFSEAIALKEIETMFQQGIVTFKDILAIWDGNEDAMTPKQFIKWYQKVTDLYDDRVILGVADCDADDEDAPEVALKEGALGRQYGEVRKLFREKCDENELMTFEQLLEVSEIAGYLKEGELQEEELEDFFDTIEKQEEDVIDIVEFSDILAKIDDIFEVVEDEEEEEDAGTVWRPALAGVYVEPRDVTPTAREAVKEARTTEQGWQMFEDTLEDGIKCCRAPRYLLQGTVENPLRNLKEESSRVMYRLRIGMQAARTDFAKWAVQQVKEHCEQASSDIGITYMCFGSMQLYQDWEVLEALLEAGVKIYQIRVVEFDLRVSEGMAFEAAKRAREDLASWFAKYGVDVLAFRNFDSMAEWVTNNTEETFVDVVALCDVPPQTMEILDEEDNQKVIAPGAVELRLEQYPKLETVARKLQRYFVMRTVCLWTPCCKTLMFLGPCFPMYCFLILQ